MFGWNSEKKPRKTLEERFGWLWRHYGVRRLALILLAAPIYYVARWATRWWIGFESSPENSAIVTLHSATHDLWFGMWVASATAPLWWIAGHYCSAIDIRWGFHSVAFVWLFDGVAALVIGTAELLPRGLHPSLAAIERVAIVGLIPAALSLLPLGVLETRERIMALPIVVRWRYSGRQEQADWITPHVLKKHARPLKGAKRWFDTE